MRIDLEGVHKSYRTRIGLTQILKNVNLHVNAGEHVGILGQNGSGKSTLIRILSGTERPTSGIVRRGMSVSWPLAFGGAFLNALTGLDNFRFVCRLYGVNPKDKIPFVEDFTELGKYLREPVRNYSSGMRARLAFAASMAIDFDCYLIDEIVAVGDDRFQRKCQVELFEKRADKALLIVSHSPDFIRSHCQKASVLVAGELSNFDNVDEAYAFYSSHELAMQPHMQDAPPPAIVHLPENPVEIVAEGYAAANDRNEFDDFLDKLAIDKAPVFDSCDLVGRLDRSGMTGAALAMCEWLTKRNPSEPLFWVTLGDLYASQRQHRPCVGAYRESIRLDPNSYWGNRNLATELFNVGYYQEAVPFYEAAIAIAPSATAKLELRLRWLDCHVLMDRITSANRSDFGVRIDSFSLVDQSALAMGDGSSGRFAVGGIVGGACDASAVRCEFRIGDDKWDGKPTFARNSIRRLASCSECDAFAFVHHAPIPDGADEVHYILTENGETRLSGTIPIRRIGDLKGDPDLRLVDAARNAHAEHREEACALLYGASADEGSEVDIIAFAESLIGVGLYDEAESRLLDWMGAHDHADPDRPFVLDLLCQELARSRIPGWRGVIEKLLANEGAARQSVSLLANLGHSRVSEKLIADAIELYAEASERAKGQELIHFARGIHTAKFAVEVPRAASVEPPSRDSEVAPEMVHLFACDAGYFRQFAEALVESSFRRRDGVRLRIHAHIVNPTEDSFALAEQLKSAFGLITTTEQSPAGVDEHAMRAYFTCARFLVAPSLLRKYGCPILITEADALINWSWLDIREHVTGADVGYRRSSMWNWVPWTKIPAGLYLFAASERGIAQADYIERFIRYAFDREGAGETDLWTVDQVALWLAQATSEGETSVHLPMNSILTLATGDKTNIASA